MPGTGGTVGPVSALHQRRHVARQQLVGHRLVDRDVAHEATKTGDGQVTRVQ